MKRTVAVDRDLRSTADALRSAGYEVVPLDGDRAHEAAAIVVAGGADDMLGITRSCTRAPVIAARGLSGAQIADLLDERLGPNPQ